MVESTKYRLRKICCNCNEMSPTENKSCVHCGLIFSEEEGEFEEAKEIKTKKDDKLKNKKTSRRDK